MFKALLNNVRDLIDAQLTCKQYTSVIHINRSDSNKKDDNSKADNNEKRKDEEEECFTGCFRVYI